MVEAEFICGNCGMRVKLTEYGTLHRNHCPYCLWSKHLDEKKPGDRQSICRGLMKPMGVTFKDEDGQKGELMLVHLCTRCGIVGKNRIAGDDTAQTILDVFSAENALSDGKKEEIRNAKISLATEMDREEIETQLFGKKN